MASKLKVHVTPELIGRATERDSRHCMIAEAIQQARPEYRKVMVDLATIRWTNPRTRKRYICLTPEAAAKSLVDFDQGKTVEPFSLSLEPIQVTPIARQVRAKDGKPGTNRSNRGKKTLRPDGTIEGGEPIPPGHLSNTKLSGPNYRMYGRRLLRA